MTKYRNGFDCISETAEEFTDWLERFLLRRLARLRMNRERRKNPGLTPGSSNPVGPLYLRFDVPTTGSSLGQLLLLSL
jgi:hypothetical protein